MFCFNLFTVQLNFQFFPHLPKHLVSFIQVMISCLRHNNMNQIKYEQYFIDQKKIKYLQAPPGNVN